jgi:hypothetical protein
MKKARVMLTALIVLALVGGALAFKANTAIGGNLKCTYLPGEPPAITSYQGECPLVTYIIDPTNGDDDYFCTDLHDQNADWCYRSSVVFNP